MPGPEAADVTEIVSPVPFKPTLDRLIHAIEAAGMMLFAHINHAAGAQEIGSAMPPTVVLIYGSPKGGTPIMQAAPLAALDLPLRVLVREAEDGRTRVAFHRAAPMLRRAGVPEALATRLDPAQRLLAEALRA
jgi:uncharacterized protein (DUF302 family)